MSARVWTAPTANTLDQLDTEPPAFKPKRLLEKQPGIKIRLFLWLLLQARAAGQCG